MKSTVFLACVLLIAMCCRAEEVDFDWLKSQVESNRKAIALLKPITSIASDEHVNVLSLDFNCKTLLPRLSQQKVKYGVSGQVIVSITHGKPECFAVLGVLAGGKDRMWISARNEAEAQQLADIGLQYLSANRPNKPDPTNQPMTIAMLSEREG